MKKTALFMLLALSMMSGPAYAAPSVKISSSEVVVTESAANEFLTQMKAADFSQARLKLKDVSDEELAKICAACPGVSMLEIDSKSLTSIKPLAGLTKLAKFRLRAESVQDMTPLAKLTGLQELNITNKAMGPDLKWMAGLTNLKVIDIFAGPALTSFEGLPSLASLAAVRLGGAIPADLTPILSLSGVRRVELTGCTIADLTPLTKLPTLADLSLYGCTVKDFSPLANCPKLRKLTYYATKGSDYSTLGKLTQVTELKGGMTKLDNISWVASLPNLKTFDVFSEYVADYSPLIKTGVEDFQIWDMRVPVGDLSAVGQIKSLKKLTLWSVNGAANSKALAGLTNLEKFRISSDYNKKGGEPFDCAAAEGWGKVTEIEIAGAALANTDKLAKAARLKRLKLQKLAGEVSLSFLGKMTSLTFLEIDQSKVKDFDALAGCTGLTSIKLNKVEGAVSLAALKKLPALKSLTVNKGAFPDSELAGFAPQVKINQR